MRLASKRSRSKADFWARLAAERFSCLAEKHFATGTAGRIDMDDASDGELLELARQGHPDAFSTLVRRHDRYLYRVARSVLRDDDEAEDVVQQTYLQAYLPGSRLMTHFHDGAGSARRLNLVSSTQRGSASEAIS